MGLVGPLSGACPQCASPAGATAWGNNVVPCLQGRVCDVSKCLLPWGRHNGTHDRTTELIFNMMIPTNLHQRSLRWPGVAGRRPGSPKEGRECERSVGVAATPEVPTHDRPGSDRAGPRISGHVPRLGPGLQPRSQVGATPPTAFPWGPTHLMSRRPCRRSRDPALGPIQRHRTWHHTHTIAVAQALVLQVPPRFPACISCQHPVLVIRVRPGHSLELRCNVGNFRLDLAFVASPSWKFSR